MKLRLISLNETGAEALQQFYKETNRKKTFKEKMVLAGAKVLGNVKTKLYSTKPYTLTVSFSAWKRIPKHLMNTSQVEPLLKEHWFPSLIINVDYKMVIL